MRAYNLNVVLRVHAREVRKKKEERELFGGNQHLKDFLS
jgi:hypothetical protein